MNNTSDASPTRSYKKYVYILLAISFFIYWVIGWTSVHTMVHSDFNKHITFTTSMIRVKFLNKEFGDINLISDYVIFSNGMWKNLHGHFYVKDTIDIDSCEVFTVLDKYVIKRHGLLESAFRSDIPVVSVKSSDGVVSVLLDAEYAAYVNYDKSCLEN